jgi:hypothetical protein
MNDAADVHKKAIRDARDAYEKAEQDAQKILNIAIQDARAVYWKTVKPMWDAYNNLIKAAKNL